MIDLDQAKENLVPGTMLLTTLGYKYLIVTTQGIFRDDGVKYMHFQRVPECCYSCNATLFNDEGILLDVKIIMIDDLHEIRHNQAEKLLCATSICIKLDAGNHGWLQDVNYILQTQQ